MNQEMMDKVIQPSSNVKHFKMLFQASYHGKQIAGFVESHGTEYASVKLVNHEENVKEWHARNMGM